MRLLCRIGLHRWLPARTHSVFGSIVDWRCPRCGRWLNDGKGAHPVR